MQLNDEVPDVTPQHDRPRAPTLPPWHPANAARNPRTQLLDVGGVLPGGSAGVAAPPGEGAREREAVTADRDFVLREIRAHFQLRGCIGETRGRYLVRRIDAALAAPAPSSPRAEAPEAEPALDAAALVELQALLDRLTPAVSNAVYCAHPSSPGHLDALVEASHAVDALTLWRSVHRDTLSGPAALRRAAPGAAPEREAPDGWELKCRDCGHSGALHDADGCMAIELHPHRHDCTCKRALATPAPTGGESEQRVQVLRLRAALRDAMGYAERGQLDLMRAVAARALGEAPDAPDAAAPTGERAGGETCCVCNGAGCIECGGTGRWYHRAPGTRPPAPRDPAAGATPAREETGAITGGDSLDSRLRDALEVMRREARTHGPGTNGKHQAWFIVNTLEAARAALRERDAAREDAARKDAGRLDALEAEMLREPLLLHSGNVDTRGFRGLGLRPGRLHRTLREAIDSAFTPLFAHAARAATAEGRTP